jgi:hypothetical protein
MTDDALTFDATVAKVQTLVDNGIRITLDLPETAIEAAAVLMALKRKGVAMEVSVKIAQPAKQVTTGEQTRHMAERPKRQSKRTRREGPNASRSTQ